MPIRYGNRQTYGGGSFVPIVQLIAIDTTYRLRTGADSSGPGRRGGTAARKGGLLRELFSTLREFFSTRYNTKCDCFASNREFFSTPGGPGAGRSWTLGVGPLCAAPGAA